MSYFNKIVSVFDPTNESAFGDLIAVDNTPVFQCDFVYGLNTQLWQTGVTAGAGSLVDTNSSRLRLQSGTGATGFAYVLPRRSLKYRAGQGMTARFTPIFTTGVTSSNQYFGMGSIVSNNIFDGYFFGFNGTSFGILHMNGGATASFTAQTSWNGDKVDGSAGTSFTWDKTKGTPVMIRYPFLGYGDINFFVQNPTSADWILVHTIRYANTSASTQLTNPNLQVFGFVQNTGNTSNLIMYCGSIGVFINGVRSYIGNPKWATSVANKSVSSTEGAVTTIKNCTTFNSVTNRGLIRLGSISIGSQTNNTSGIVLMKVNATLGGSPSYTTISGTSADQGVTITAGNSIASVDIAGATVSGGTYIFNFAFGAQTSSTIDLTPYDIFIAPTETMTFSVISSAAANVSFTVNWTEDI